MRPSRAANEMSGKQTREPGKLGQAELHCTSMCWSERPKQGEKIASCLAMYNFEMGALCEKGVGQKQVLDDKTHCKSQSLHCATQSETVLLAVKDKQKRIVVLCLSSGFVLAFLVGAVILKLKDEAPTCLPVVDCIVLEATAGTNGKTEHQIKAKRIHCDGRSAVDARWTPRAVSWRRFRSTTQNC